MTNNIQLAAYFVAVIIILVLSMVIGEWFYKKSHKQDIEIETKDDHELTEQQVSDIKQIINRK